VAPVAARIAVFTLAVLLAGWAAIALDDDRDCYGRSQTIIGFVLGEGAEKVTDGFVDEYMEQCRGSHQLALASTALLRGDRVDQAARLAKEAIRREPGNYEGWVALSRTLRERGLDGAAERAMREARRLNPRFGRAPG
jgi:predicted Zn-dependent protease